MPYAHNHLKVNVPKRSGFDKTHRNTGTLTCGTITPILCDELIPNSRVSLRINLASQLPPLASDTYMNCKMKVEAFFTPGRLLCKSYEDWFCDNGPNEGLSNTTVFSDIMPRLPYLDKNSAYTNLGAGSLGDYLGIREVGTAGRMDLNSLPFINYHLVWQEWYRNPRVQKSAFIPLIGAGSASSRSHLMSAPYMYFADSASASAGQSAVFTPLLSASLSTDWNLNDGVSLFALRQRNFGLDYFTGARVAAQQGPAVSLTLPISGVESGGSVTGTGNFTIAALRAANSLQQFRERNNIPSPRLVDQVKARYGANLSDGVAQRPICIGTATYDVDSTGISQTAEGTGSSSSNPFNSVAAQYGRAYASGSDFVINDFIANEPGYLLVNLTLVPEVTYYTGLDRMFVRYTAPGSIVEMAHPLLQNMGDQPIYQYEVAGNSGTYWDHVFGYQDRFADWMYKPNSVHGLMKNGQSLASFVLQRGFSGASPVEISSSFLEIPTNYMDQCFAVASAVSGVSAWYDAMLEYKVSMPLAEWSIPSLQDPAYEHGQSVTLRRNGQIF